MRRAFLAATIAVSLALSSFGAGAGAGHRAPTRALTSAPDVLRGDLGAATGSPRRVASSMLRRYADRFGIEPADFRWESVRHSLAGVHVRGRQFLGGVPIDRTAAAVHIVDGRVVQIEVHSLPEATASPAPAPLSRGEAVDAVVRAHGTSRLLRVHAERLLVAAEDGLQDVWRVSGLSLSPPAVIDAQVDSRSGAVTLLPDASVHLDGSATVFDPNPIVTLRDSSVRQPLEVGSPVDADLDSDELTKALRKLPLKDLDPAALMTGRLQGPWVNVIAVGLVSPDGNFNFTRGDPRFEATMAYAHLDRIQRYYRSLGFRGKASINAESQEIVAMPVPGFDNSFYRPGEDLMLLGSGGVDDGEDAEVILHEYGHATHFAQVPDWGSTAEGGAMGEGFGDFLAGAYFARSISKGFGDACVADWDATSYSSDKPPCLRRLDSKKVYPDDIEGQVHADGEIWSAFLWRLRSSLGRTERQRSDNSLRLVLASHEFLTGEAEFGDGVAALRTAARALGRPGWARLIDRAARSNGLPLK